MRALRAEAVICSASSNRMNEVNDVDDEQFLPL